MSEMDTDSENEGNYKGTLTIKPSDLLISLEQVLEESSNSIFLGLSNLNSVTQKPDDFLTSEDDFHSFPVFGKNYNLDSRKEIFKNWLLKKGFEDLIRAATNALVSANVVLDLKKELAKRGSRSTIQEFIELIKNPELSNNPTKRHLPELLSNIKKSLSGELAYEQEIKSINNLRRCLVHRNGRVSKIDTYGKDELTLNWIAFQPIYRKEDTGEVTEIRGPRVLEGPGQLDVKLVNRSRIFKLNEPVTFDFREFNELIWTVSLFGQDLISKFKI
jgi:hypothetical protein